MAQSKASAGLAASGSTCSARAHTSTIGRKRAAARSGCSGMPATQPGTKRVPRQAAFEYGRRLTPGLILEELRDSSPIACPEQGIFRIGWVPLSCKPPARSGQAGGIMVHVRLKTEGSGPFFLQKCLM